MYANLLAQGGSAYQGDSEVSSRLLWRAIGRCDWDLLALTLDLAVPPLSLFGLLVTVMYVFAGLAAFFGLSTAALTAANLLAFLLAVFLAWLKYGREAARRAFIDCSVRPRKARTDRTKS
jgi:hypothetical protein